MAGRRLRGLLNRIRTGFGNKPAGLRASVSQSMSREMVGLLEYYVPALQDAGDAGRGGEFVLLVIGVLMEICTGVKCTVECFRVCVTERLVVYFFNVHTFYETSFLASL